MVNLRSITGLFGVTTLATFHYNNDRNENYFKNLAQNNKAGCAAAKLVDIIHGYSCPNQNSKQ